MTYTFIIKLSIGSRMECQQVKKEIHFDAHAWFGSLVQFGLMVHLLGSAS